MKKIKLIVFLAIIICAIAAISSCNTPIKTSEDVEFKYRLDSDGKGYTLTGSNISGKTLEDNWEMVDVVIPSTHKGLPVTCIDHYVFADCEILRSVTVPESVNSIYAYAFKDCTSIESIHLPASIRDFYGSSVYRCFSIKSITVDEENRYLCSIDGNVYSKDKRKFIYYATGKDEIEFTVPQSVTTIDRYSFAQCVSLERINIPSSVTKIDEEGIIFCQKLRGVTVDENNTVYKSIDGNLYDKSGKTFMRLYNRAEKNLNLVIPNGVVTIDDSAAWHYGNLTSVTLSDTVTYIGVSAFSGTALKSVTIPSNVMFIGSSAFSGCDDLETVQLENTGKWKAIPQSGKFASSEWLEAKDLQSPKKVAKYLKDDYVNCNWERQL